MFRERLLSSLVIVPLVGSAFYFGKVYFAALILLLSVAGAIEYRRMMGLAGTDIDKTFIPVSALVAVSGYYHPSTFVAVLLGGAVLLLSIALVKTGSAPSAMYSLSGEMYIGGLLGALVLLRHGPDGLIWAVFTLLVTWATDVGAYLGGMALGRHKLAPAISPGKSWEGGISGIAAAALAGAVLSRFMGSPAQFAALAGAMLGVLAELGDLVESSLKRFAKVKDSGSIIPGHGGVLDRFDSLLFTGAGGLLLRTLHRTLFH